MSYYMLRNSPKLQEERRMHDLMEEEGTVKSEGQSGN